MFDLGEKSKTQKQLLDEFNAMFSENFEQANQHLMAEFFASVFRYEPVQAREILLLMEREARSNE